MNPSLILHRLRQFLLAVSAFIFVVTPFELVFIEHFETPTQIIPFLLCLAGVIAVAVALWRPRRLSLVALRAVMVVIALGSFAGTVLHIANNIAFELDIRPTATLLEVIPKALGGASPLLAPGILALGAILSLAATYYHPALHGGIESNAA